MIIDKIYDYLKIVDKTVDEATCDDVSKLSGYTFKRQFMTKDSEPKLRMSSAGKCIRQLCYIYHKYPQNGKTIDSRARLVFWAGDLTETTIISLAKLAGCVLTSVGLNQLNLSMDISGVKIEGHPDGMVLHNGELCLLEVKSMSSFAFKRFENGDIDDSYIMQINLYMGQLGLKKCIFVAQNKDSGILGETLIHFDDAVYSIGLERLCSIIDSDKNKLQPRPYRPDAKGFYDWRCAYCPYFNTCLVEPGLAERVVVRNSYKLKEIKK